VPVDGAGFSAPGRFCGAREGALQHTDGSDRTKPMVFGSLIKQLLAADCEDGIIGINDATCL